MPTELERAFLRIVTLGNPELERQVASCEIADYDVTGWCYVNVLEGPASREGMVDGPSLDIAKIENVGVDVTWPDPPPTTFALRRGRALRTAAPPQTGEPRVLFVETILWIAGDGMLYAIEVIAYGDGALADPYRLFVDVAQLEPHLLRY